MKNTTNILLLCLMVFLLSCDDYLNIVPKGEVVPNNVKELGLLLRGNVGYKYTSRSPTFMTDELIVSESTFSGLFTIHKNGYTWQPIYNLGETDIDWKQSYQQIYITNYVLSLIDDAALDGFTEEDKNRVKAEALSIRANEYFDLVTIYGKHYNTQTSESDLAIPLLLIADIEASLPRSSVANIYQQILDDLLLSIDLFTSDQLHTERKYPTKTGVYGLLSRIYLYRGEWQNAIDYANLALNNYNTLYDYNNIPVERSDSAKSLYSDENIEFILFRSCTQSYCRDHEVIVHDDLVNLFEPNDKRFAFFIKQNTNGDNIYEPANSSNVFPLSGISTPELLLTRAEANARLNNNTEAMNDLFTLRSNRFDITAYADQAAFDAAITLTATDSEEAIQQVLTERRRELMFHGLRWFDMKRLMTEGRYTQTLTRTIDGGTYTLEPDADNWVVDISPDIKSRNPNID